MPPYYVSLLITAYLLIQTLCNSFTIVNMKSARSTLSSSGTAVTKFQFSFRMDLVILILIMMILINCCDLNQALPSPSFRKTCGTDLSKRIILICKEFGGMCSIHSIYKGISYLIKFN